MKIVLMWVAWDTGYFWVPSKEQLLSEVTVSPIYCGGELFLKFTIQVPATHLVAQVALI